MQFDSLVFAAFFFVFIATYWRLRSRIAQNWLILAGSYLFYGWWDWRFLGLIAVSTVVDFFVARGIARNQDNSRTRFRLVTLSILVNLGILGFFKYYDFFATSLVDALGTFGMEVDAPTLHVILPVGISFYTFQTMAYTIDVYRGKQRACTEFLSFACYVAFFPQLVAGPIERAPRLVPQFLRERSINMDQWRSGATLMVFGLVKKIAIADNVAPFANVVFSPAVGDLSGPLVLAGTLAFAIQIYADFSAYSDIARGIARLLGFELCINFNKPYVATGPSDFWRRWHISLSQWLRDYLYIPLGGNRHGASSVYRNLMITMMLGGLWHGASFNFILWGIYHGALLCLYRVLDLDGRIARANRFVRDIIAAPVFFLFTLYGWLLFRARSWDQIADMTYALVGSWASWTHATAMILVVAYFSLPIVAHHILARGKHGEKWQATNPWLWRISLTAVILYGFTHARASEQAFIYFQF